MPKRCTKRKLRKLQQAERLAAGNSIDIHCTSQKTSKSCKQRIREFFKRITNRSNVAGHGAPTCANNNNNKEKLVIQDKGDPAMAACLDDIQVTTKEIIDQAARKADNAADDVFDTVHNITKQKVQHETTPVLLPIYTTEQALLVSALIEMLNNEPNLQEVGDLKGVHDRVDPDLVKYVVGESIFTGKFNLKILDTIGEGSQATIYKVSKDESTLAAKISKEPAFTKYLKHEYDLVSKLNHDNIVALHDQVPDGFLMEVLQHDLVQHMRLNFDFDAMKLPRRDRITVGILRGLSFLHKNDIAHLDVKPDNILLTADGQPKLADFGLALRTRDEDGQLQSLKGIRGSLPYLAPEVLARDKNNYMTAIDAWAVGVLMYTILTGGTLPFGNKSAREIYQHQRQRLRLPHRFKKVMSKDENANSYFCIVYQLLNFQPEMRCTIDGALGIISLLT